MAAMMHEQLPEIDEELQPLDEAAQPRPARRAGATRAALLALGLGAAAAAAAAYGLVRGGREPAEAKPSAAISAVETDAAPGKTALEQDLGDFISDQVTPLSRGLGGSLANTAQDLFHHVLHTSGVHDELTSEERRAYEDRFVASMIGMADTNAGPEHDYVSRARKHIQGDKPVMTKKLASVINNRQNKFKVEMKDWMLDESMDSLSLRLINLEQVPFEVPEHKKMEGNLGHGVSRDMLPPTMDSRDMWPLCRAVIGKAHNQGKCGSCWVFGALGSLDSRMCIATMGKFSGSMAALSRGYGASCSVGWDGCQGGWPHQVYDYIEKTSGIPTSSCVPYFGGKDYADHWHSSVAAPSCPTQCDSRYGRAMQQDFFRPLGVGNYKVVTNPDAKGLEDMRSALYNGGPVPYALAASYEFMAYSGGIFDASCGRQANHAVQAIGFGVGYFLSLNSWGPEWGEDGTFKIAPCMVYHYAVPGEITEKEFPLPFPEGSEPLDAVEAPVVATVPTIPDAPTVA